MGSGSELSYHLLLAKDLGLLTVEEHAGIDASLGRVMRMLSSLSAKVRNPSAA
jgi:hypothetical protein